MKSGILRVAWNVARLPVYAFLILLEPIVRVLLCAFALLGLLTALFFGFAAHRPEFPFWGTLGLSVACVLVLRVYYGVIQLLAQRPT